MKVRFKLIANQEMSSPIQSPNSNLSIKSPKYKAPIKYINFSNFLEDVNNLDMNVLCNISSSG